MIGLTLPSSVQRLLCIGAHCDDVEIGCGGMLTTLARRRPDLEITVAALASDAQRAAESRAALGLLLDGGAKWRLETREFRNGFFPAQWADIKVEIEQLKRGFAPDMVLTHCRDDLHQDHRVLAELAWNAFRDHWILEFEIPKYDGDLGRPNAFFPVGEAEVARKIDALLSGFPSQATKPWFTAETFRALMRLRGIECQSPSGYAEAFYCRKLVMAT